MKNQKVIILGAGVSGLSFAYYLKKYHPEVDFTIYEESDRVGGVVYSEEKLGCVLEWGPRGIRPKGKGQCVLELVEELGLWDDLVFANDDAKKRYLYYDGSLHILPSSLKSLLLSPYLKLFFKAVVRDLKSEKFDGDETISEFIDRHFGYEFRNLFIDSMVSGIWAGDVEKMSISATLPLLKKLEKSKASVIKGLFAHKSEGLGFKKYPKAIVSKALFSFNGGVKQLVDSLKGELDDSIVYNADVQMIDQQSATLVVNGEKVVASRIVSTIPAYKLSSYVSSETKELLDSISYSPVALCNFILNNNVLSFDGFGFLVPSKEKSIVLGMVANSNTFPDHAPKDMQVYTVMLGGARYDIRRLRELDLKKESVLFLEKVFKTKISPLYSELKLIEKAIPQYELGHLDKVLKLEGLSSPKFTILGNYMYGVSLIDIISKSQSVAKDFFS